MKKEFIAKVAHEVNRAYCAAIGDDSQVSWEDAPEWQKETVLNGVIFHESNTATHEESHQAWAEQKIADGWVYGEEKSEEHKTHPCLVDYADLPAEQKVKDFLLAAVVKQLSLYEEQVVPPVIISGPAAVTNGDVPIKYIGKRQSNTDVIYGTMITWEKDETKLVPAAAAAKMLKHKDVYELGKITAKLEPAPAMKVEDKDEMTEEELVREAIMNLDRKDSLIQFAKTNFSYDIVKGTKTIADLKAEVINLLDQFGMPGSE